MKKKAIIVDIDGTLSNPEHRVKFAIAKDWKKFYDHLGIDEPNKWCVDLVHAMWYKGYEPILVTGRPDSHKVHTEVWLAQHGIKEWSKLYMRRENDHRHDHEIKLEIYKNHIEPHYDVLFCLEDRKQVVDMWRSQGLTVLHCAEGNF